VLYKNREISPLEREEGYGGKDLEKTEKVSFKTRMEDPVGHANYPPPRVYRKVTAPY